MSEVQWHKFDYEDKTTAPPVGCEVWVTENFYYNGAVLIGWFNGFTMETYELKDDCNIGYWAYIDYPDTPEEND